MRSTFHGLETAKRSLFTQQAALNTTGHNIANANTVGYSRQVVNMVASRPIEAYGIQRTVTPGQLGTGVEFSSITRIRESFLDAQFRNENKSLGNWTIRSDTLEKLETILNEPSETGLRTVLDNFWNAWSDLSKDPQSITGRKIVVESAIALTDAFNHLSSQLDDLTADLTEDINIKLADVNSKLATIADLNVQIRRIEGLGDNANDLRDQRDLLVDEISRVISIRVVETESGYNIYMGNTALLENGALQTLDAAQVEAARTTGDLDGGEVLGLLVSRDDYVANYRTMLNTLVDSIVNGEITVTIPAGSVLPEGTELNGIIYTGANRVLTSDLTVTVKGLNGLHKLGYAFNDAGFAPGIDLFTTADGSTTGITAGNIKVNAAIVADPSLIATSMRTTGNPEEVVKGNNDLALLISKMRDAKFTFTSPNSPIQTGTLNDYYRSITGQLGVQAQEANRQVTNLSSVVAQIDSRRQSVSGVSLDEEMANMIKFQHAYNAAARIMTTMDEVLDRIINGMGVVGR
jgi:flagellar hook-associated protein 1 FlgK